MQSNSPAKCRGLALCKATLRQSVADLLYAKQLSGKVSRTCFMQSKSPASWGTKTLRKASLLQVGGQKLCAKQIKKLMYIIKE
jgi:hypothetical protein